MGACSVDWRFDIFGVAWLPPVLVIPVLALAAAIRDPEATLLCEWVSEVIKGLTGVVVEATPEGIGLVLCGISELVDASSNFASL